MDLTLYFAVIRRFRVLIGVGAIAAIVLAVLSMARIDLANGKPALSYRADANLDESLGAPHHTDRVPVGASGSTRGTPGRPGCTGHLVVRGSEPLLPTRVVLRATREQRRRPSGDQAPVEQGRHRAGCCCDGRFVVQRRSDFRSSTSSAPGQRRGSPSDSRTIGTATFREYVAAQQRDAAIPDSQRVDVQVVTSAEPPLLAQGRKKTLPIAIFLGVMIMTVGAAFILENLRPRIQVASGSRVPDDLDTPRRAAA